MLKNSKYSVTLPMLRSKPPITYNNNKNVEELPAEGTNLPSALQEVDDASGWGSFEQKETKEQRTHFKSKASLQVQMRDFNIDDHNLNSYPKTNPRKSASVRDVYSLLEKKMTNVWKPYEIESMDFWDRNLPQPPTHQIGADAPMAPSSNNIENIKLLNLLRDDTSKNENKISDFVKKKLFERHSVGCPHENSIFTQLRQIYPNKQTSGLWDLFQKCNGDIDWAVDILLKEDELKMQGCDEDLHFDNYGEADFVCSCECDQKNSKKGNEFNFFPAHTEITGNTVQSRDLKQPFTRAQRTRLLRHNYMSDPILNDLKENVKKQFVLADDQYSQNLLNLRNRRRGTLPAITPSSASTLVERCDNEAEYDDDDGESENYEEPEMLEMCLGEQLVEQLLKNFKNETSLEIPFASSLPLNPKVFMPRSLAKQLYLLWMESAYNHLEEERQQMVREDEEFARLLKHPQHSEYKQSPNNLREMLDIEYAWNVYLREKEELEMQKKDVEKKSQPTDMASRLTQIKLCETFPEIPPDTLLDIMATTDNSYNDTMTILSSTMEVSNKNVSKCQDNVHGDPKKKLNEDRYRTNDGSGSMWDYSAEKYANSSWSPEDAKRQALREFEEARNLASHHCQLRAECFQKAKESIQAGNGGAGLYYSQIANLHKQKIFMYNHRAANCIMNVHKYTHNNPDHLDLHYLHILEALECLDLFLDRHITALRISSRSNKHVFIITGRGKHSAGGVSVIKSKVKNRLEERSLKWNEVNPGLLKVKIFSSSRHSQSFF